MVQQVIYLSKYKNDYSNQKLGCYIISFLCLHITLLVYNMMLLQIDVEPDT